VSTNRKNIDIRSESGQSMTEFALVLPLLCVLLFGIIQFGIAWNSYVTITDAARAGARKAAVSRHTNPIAAGCATAKSSAGKLDLTKPGASCSTVVAGPLDRPGADVTVTVRYPYTIDLFGIPLATGTLETKTTERME
jgi:Flp pilus assembly protein TadG